jgi:hypothetical protein
LLNKIRHQHLHNPQQHCRFLCAKTQATVLEIRIENWIMRNQGEIAKGQRDLLHKARILSRHTEPVDIRSSLAPIQQIARLAKELATPQKIKDAFCGVRRVNPI